MSSGRCLQIDFGNSSAKWRLLTQDGQIVTRGRYVHGEETSRNELLNCTGECSEIWVASVASADTEAEFSNLLETRWRLKPWFARSQKQTGDLVNSYADPGRMGVDRWLAMLGARKRSQQRVCVVDAGSALTIDFIAASGQHEGGYILPGPALMERALLLDTDRVRFEEDVDYALTPGCSTAEAVRHGIALAQVGAVRVAVEEAQNAPGFGEAPVVYFCGGGAQALAALFGGNSIHAPDLVFEGLQLMAQYRDATAGKG
ncbi:MAG: type III pantothenate kinase [Halioglobus sp.]